MVPKAGLEPARGNPQQILSLSCLPIPPLRHWMCMKQAVSIMRIMEDVSRLNLLYGEELVWERVWDLD